MATCMVFRSVFLWLLGSSEAEEGWGSWGEAGGSLPPAGMAGRQESPPALLGSVTGHVAGLSDPFRGTKLGGSLF